jgi:hypothetical protein
MPYPYPYKFSDWAAYNRPCPDHSGVMTTATSFSIGGLIYWRGFAVAQQGSVGSSTNTSIAKSLIGGAQTSGNAVVTGLYLDSSSGVPPGGNNIVFRLNNGDNSNTNPPNSWKTLIYQWTTSGVTYTQEFDRSSAVATRLSGAYNANDWVWFWSNPGSPSNIPQWNPPENGKLVTWTVTQITA